MSTSDYWQCPKCNAVLKKGLNEVAGMFKGVMGTGTCTRCGAGYSQTEIYDGKWDVEVLSFTPPGEIRRTGYGFSEAINDSKKPWWKFW